jgi:hypothetical protein
MSMLLLPYALVSERVQEGADNIDRICCQWRNSATFLNDINMFELPVLIKSSLRTSLPQYQLTDIAETANKKFVHIHNVPGK